MTPPIPRPGGDQQLALADKLEPQQYATGISFSYLEFRMVIDALRRSVAPDMREALKLAYIELKKHDADYHYRTPVTINSKIVDALASLPASGTEGEKVGDGREHIDKRLADLAEANAIYGKDQRLSAPDKIARNEREISWLKDLRSMLATPPAPVRAVCPTCGNSPPTALCAPVRAAAEPGEMRAALEAAKNFIGQTSEYKRGDVGASSIIKQCIAALSASANEGER